MIEAFSMPFMQRALLAGVIVAVLSGYYGAFIVQRRLSFLGAGLSHAAFGGVALGLLIGTNPILTAAPFTVGVALGITWLRGHTKMGGDTAIGIFFSVSMALGIVFIALKQDYTAEAFTYLFGSILAVNQTDIIATLAVLTLTLLLLPLWGKWSYATFDRELATADRIKVEAHDYLLSALIGVTVVVAVKVLGIVLMAAFLVIPAAAAKLIAPSFIAMTLLAILIGVASTLIGLVASYVFDLPSGATIILTQAFLFFLLMPLKRK